MREPSVDGLLRGRKREDFLCPSVSIADVVALKKPKLRTSVALVLFASMKNASANAQGTGLLASSRTCCMVGPFRDIFLVKYCDKARVFRMLKFGLLQRIE